VVNTPMGRAQRVPLAEPFVTLLWGQGKLPCRRKPLVFWRPMEPANLQILCILQMC